MNNQWGRQPHIPESVLVIVVIIILGYLLFSNFFKDISSQINPTTAASSLNDVNSSSINDPNALNSSGSSSPLFTSGDITLNNGSENNALASGCWVLFVANGATQQLSISTQDYAFVQGLIQSDSKGSGTVKIFLIDNGQIHPYTVSNEIFSILSNMATIIARASNPSASTSASPSSSTSSSSSSSASVNSTESTPTSPNSTSPATAISETLTVSNPSTTGFTVTLNPALNGLTPSNFTLVNSSGNPVTLTGATTSDNGTTYTMSAALSAGQTYTLTAAHTGYTFGTASNIVVPQ